MLKKMRITTAPQDLEDSLLLILILRLVTSLPLVHLHFNYILISAISTKQGKDILSSLHKGSTFNGKSPCFPFFVHVLNISFLEITDAE